MREFVINEMMEYLSKLTEENGKLHENLQEAYHGMKQHERKSFMKGLGAGMAVTPFTFLLGWKVVELMVIAAEWIDVTPGVLAAVSVCVIGGFTMYLHSDSVLKTLEKTMDLLLSDFGFSDDEEDDFVPWTAVRERERGK